MSATEISWTDAVCNPLPGCKKVSPGCLHCYAEKMARRLKAMGHQAYQDVVDEHGWTGKVGCNLDAMKVPGKGKMVFVQSMGDLFYEGIIDEQRDRVYKAIAVDFGNRYQVLTKRPEQTLRYHKRIESMRPGPANDYTGSLMHVRRWPFDNLWLGVTCENQDYQWRIETLRGIPAAVRFVSFEPLLGPIANVSLTGIARVVLSYYAHPRLAELYPDWEQHKIEVSKAMAHQGRRGENNVKAVEVLLVNQRDQHNLFEGQP